MRWLPEKGKWADNKSEEASEKSVIAKHATSRFVVLIDRKPKTIGELVEDLSRTKGETRIRYHKLIDEPTIEDPVF